MKWAKTAGPGHAFFYRSFLFLALAGAIAESWGVRRVLQFENGVLASSIPPGSAWLMTKHAHPLLHKHVSSLFSALFGGKWDISNPFLLLTKRECANHAGKSIGKAKATRLLKKTETCWFLWSHRVIGGPKKPGIPCGICIPCLVRRTTSVDEKYAYDLIQRRVRNHPRQGANFRSYFLFLEQVLKTKQSPSDFYSMLPSSGRQLVGIDSALSLDALHQLFLRFGREFMTTFKVR